MSTFSKGQGKYFVAREDGTLRYNMLLGVDEDCNYLLTYSFMDRLCGLLVRVSGYRYRGLGFDSRRYQIF